MSNKPNKWRPNCVAVHLKPPALEWVKREAKEAGLTPAKFILELIADAMVRDGENREPAVITVDDLYALATARR